MAMPLGQGRQAKSVSWQTADQEGEQPLETSSHLVYETFGELSLADSPVKQEPPQASAGSHNIHSFRAHDRGGGQGMPLGAASLPAPWASHNLSPAYLPACSLPGPAEPPESPRVLAATSDDSYELSMLRQRVQELEEQLAAAAAAAAAREKERPSPSAAFTATMEQDLRDMQNRLRSREREAEAAQAALERGQAEAKNLAAQLQAERNTTAGLVDEVAQWRGEHAKAKKDLTALQKKLDAILAQNSLLEGSLNTLKRQNAELGKAAGEREAAMRAMQDRLQAVQGNEGSRHKQVQELVDRVEALHRENARLEQQLHEASAGAYGAREQMQQLWEEREQLHNENAALRSDMQRMGDALAAARSQLWERMSREEASVALGRPSMQHPASHLPGYVASQEAAPAAARPLQFGRQSPVDSSWQDQPGSAAQLPQRGADYRSNIPEESYTLGYGGRASEGLEQTLPGCRPAEALQMQVQHEQQWAPQSASMKTVRPEAAASHERYGEAAPAPAALRCLSFDAQAAAQPGLNAPNGWPGAAGQRHHGANAGLSPLGPEGLNPRASLPHPYLPANQHRSQTPEHGHSPEGSQGGSGPWQQVPPPAEYGSWQISAAPGLGGGFHASHPRLSSSEDGSSEATPGLKTRALAGTPPPFGSEVTLQEMLARTQALESRLMKLSMEKNELEAEHARMPTNTAGRRLQDRRRKEEIASRLEVVSKEMSNIRLQLKKLGYK